MVKKIYNILIYSIIIFIFITRMGTSYGTIGTDLDERIMMKVVYDSISGKEEKILKKLQKQYNYKGSTLDKEMKMETTIKIKKAKNEKYKIQIRKWSNYKKDK